MTYRRCYDDYVSRMPAEYQRPISEWTLDELRLRVVRHFLYRHISYGILVMAY